VDDKIKVLIASVLKPADDVRSCSKIGQSLAQTNKYEVNIIGFVSKKKSPGKNIYLHPLFNFRRNSIRRLFAPISILKKYLKLKPQLLIVNTPELLWLIIIIKILFGPKIIYDIQENYRLNIKYSTVYSGLLKALSLNYIKFLERITTHFVDGYLLAEDIYAKQLNFIQKKPYIKLLNKSTIYKIGDINPIQFKQGQPLKIIYTGTIGKEYGTLEAIEFCRKLHVTAPNITLIIVGYSPDYEYFKEVEVAISNAEYISLITQDKPVPQSQIVDKIQQSDIAILPYQLNPNISGRFPTKIYDYLALGTPMIIPPHNKWKAYLDQYKAGIIVDFTKIDTQEVVQKLHTTRFYRSRPKGEILWKSQEPTLLHFIRDILSK